MINKYKIIKQHPDRLLKNLSGFIFVFCISNFRAIGQSRTPVPTMGMRVAEDVAPYKEEYNFLMRTTRFSGVFYLTRVLFPKDFRVVSRRLFGADKFTKRLAILCIGNAHPSCIRRYNAHIAFTCINEHSHRCGYKKLAG